MERRRDSMPQTVCNALISRSNAIRYGITEPVLLGLARTIHAGDYADLEENPLVTVYTPTYNRGRILVERALPSVLSQTYANIEYLIIADCCTDETAELVSRIRDPRITLYNIPKRGYRYPPCAENHWFAGPVVAANEALKRARGKWIARIDDDDVFTPRHIEDLLRFAQKGNFEFTSALYEEERFGNRVVVDGVRARDSYYTQGPSIADDNSPKIGGTSTWLYRSYLRFFRYNIHCWRKSWNRVNDVDLSLRIFNAGVRMGFLDRVHAYVFPRPGEETVGMHAYKIAEEKGYTVHA